MDLRPFRALRYDAAHVQLADVVAPPYDVIDNHQRDVLYARSPHNVVRLILNRDADRYTSSAGYLREWIDSGLLRQDEHPALWLYTQNFTHGDVPFERTGLIGAVRLEPFSTGRIRPHERTLSGPKEDRLRLMEACRTNLSPIFGLYANRLETLARTRAFINRQVPLIDLTDDAGVRHRTWQISDHGHIATIASTLADETIFIADGHHRYETALEYRDRLRARGELAPDDPADFIMIYLCSMDDPGLLVLPTHRIVRGLTGIEPARFLASVEREFNVQRFPNSAAGRSQLLATLASHEARGHLGVVLRGADALYKIFPRDPAAIDRAAPELPPVVRRLDVTMLDRLILRGLLDLDADTAARAGQLRYSHEAHEAFESVTSGDAQLACLLGPPDLREVQAVCLSGETMPQKSTYFYPKLLTGLVFHPLTRNVGAAPPALDCARGA